MSQQIAPPFCFSSVLEQQLLLNLHLGLKLHFLFLRECHHFLSSCIATKRWDRWICQQLPGVGAAWSSDGDWPVQRGSHPIVGGGSNDSWLALQCQGDIQGMHFIPGTWHLGGSWSLSPGVPQCCRKPKEAIRNKQKTNINNNKQQQ